MATPEQLTHSSSNQTDSHAPNNGSLALRNMGGTGFDGEALTRFNNEPPVAVTIAGHFNDPEAVLCQPDARAGCRDTFVIDAVIDEHGALVPPFATTTTDSGRMTPDEARTTALGRHPGLTALATTFTAKPDPGTGSSSGDVRIDVFGWPATGTHAWLVRLVSPGGTAAPLTVLVDDSDGTAHDLPAYPAEWAPATPGLSGAVRVADGDRSKAHCGSDGTLSGGLFVRRAGAKDLLIVSPYSGGTTTMLGSTEAPLFVRGTGFETVVLDGAGTPLERGTLPFVQVCTVDQNDPTAPVIFESVGMPRG
jgi:hypothetical protein